MAKKDIVIAPPSSAPVVSNKSQAALKVQEFMQKRNVALAKSGGVANVGFLLDKSGSMRYHQDTTIQGYNDFVDRLRKLDGVMLSMWEFDDVFEQLFVAEPVSRAPRLDETNYQPRGGTFLIDAVNRQIDAMERDTAPGSKVLLAIQTDGEDTSGKSWEQLKQRIKQKRDRDGWEVMVMGAGINAYALAALLGVPEASAMSYSTEALTTDAAFKAAADVATGYLSGAKPKAEFTKDQRIAAGDKHIPKLLK